MKCLFGLMMALASASIASVAIAPAAQAQAAYGSYVGAGVAFGTSSGNSGSETSGLIAVRYRLLEVPISLRAQAMLFGGTTAIVPTVSYDIPLNWQTDAYVGAGVAFQDGDEDSASPIGDQTAFVLQPGVDYSLPNSNLVVFGNAIIAFDAYRETGGAATSFQGGVGLRF
ncbi:hypothetical protein H6F67_16055 [Microcoleus sp. FACHB-1515]|uniref:hypothetical protein n=1 Tax=Cyanophyceae TaxID=3028117 RepID=UPI0016886E4C|nr:hypothetical protein [Microcoleus sp. FACHB-1515]MBD2091361.1 hypothetical protein [Microcoleus sp. FACHB-1515]